MHLCVYLLILRPNSIIQIIIKITSSSYEKLKTNQIFVIRPLKIIIIEIISEFAIKTLMYNLNSVSHRASMVALRSCGRNPAVAITAIDIGRAILSDTPQCSVGLGGRFCPHHLSLFTLPIDFSLSKYFSVDR